MTQEVYIALLVAMFILSFIGITKLDNWDKRTKRGKVLADIEKEKLRNK